MSLRTQLVAAGLVGLLCFGCGLTSQEQLFGVIDGTPPSVIDTLPGQNWIEVPTSITARVWFSEAIDPASVGLSSIHLISGQDLTPVRFQVRVEDDGRGLVMLTPREPLISGVEYVLFISRKLTDWYGNPLDQETRVFFRTLR